MLTRPALARIPPFLLSIEDPNVGADGKVVGCANCGGLGHSISNCPKLEENQRRTIAGHVSTDRQEGMSIVNTSVLTCLASAERRWAEGTQVVIELVRHSTCHYLLANRTVDQNDVLSHISLFWPFSGLSIVEDTSRTSSCSITIPTHLKCQLGNDTVLRHLWNPIRSQIHT